MTFYLLLMPFHQSVALLASFAIVCCCNPSTEAAAAAAAMKKLDCWLVQSAGSMLLAACPRSMLPCETSQEARSAGPCSL